MNLAVTRLGAQLFSWIAHPLDRLVMRLTGQRHSVTSILTGIPVVILITRGARSGKLRRVPLLSFRDGENVGLIASNWGGAQHPAWYHNLSGDPKVWLWTAGRRFKCLAREAEDEERKRIWSQATQLYPGYDTYAIRAGNRRIPVIVLEPRD